MLVCSAEYRKGRCCKQPDAPVVEPGTEQVKHTRDRHRISNSEQPDSQDVRAENPKERSVNERKERWLVKVDLAVKSLAAQHLLSRRKPETIVLVKVSGIEDP